jgi:hypothetical protein
MNKLREKNLHGKNVPIILLTNLTTDEEKILEAVIKDKPAYYLDKSHWELNQVIKKIYECLEEKVN